MTTPTTTTYDQLRLKQSELIRKALEGSIFLADEPAELPTALTAGADCGAASAARRLHRPRLGGQGRRRDLAPFDRHV